MLKVFPWIERSFQFDSPRWMYPNLVERIRGGPARVEDAARDVPLSLMTKREGTSWSIQENIGHLLDIEPLMLGRLDDFRQKLPQLRAWEETNGATWEANHNAQPLQELLAGFRSARSTLVERFDSLDNSLIEQAAFHPRLKRPMRIIDLVYFIAEHDDYHLAKISAIKQQEWGSRPRGETF
ncbi:DinB family protein [Acidisarcina polymorpha]|uniref:DinB family protein n=1 Tax=Acidisarcina polymorpha TaxID=2211140 RepID=UPI000DEEACE3|nr:DinB family protein [Acidisarcina polymorpha]